MTDVALVCEEHDPLDGSVHGQLTCSKDVFDLASAERLAGNLQVRYQQLSATLDMLLENSFGAFGRQPLLCLTFIDRAITN